MSDGGIPDPDVQEGLQYWATQPASYDGVLGGFGNGTLPRVDALGSRQFLQHLLPELCTVPSALRPLHPPARTPARRVRALDVGAGVGRVTSDTLLPLVDDVVLLEPVPAFVNEALVRGRAAEQAQAHGGAKGPWRGIAARATSVTVLRGTLQAFDPAAPLASAELLGRVGAAADPDTGGAAAEIDSGFDVIWCQWCLGHLSDADLAAFFVRAARALRTRDAAAGEGRSVIVVKENLCSDGADGSARTTFDEEDSSLTRSDQAWKAVFKSAGLRLVQERVQHGFPDGLYVVKMYALRPIDS